MTFSKALIPLALSCLLALPTWAQETGDDAAPAEEAPADGGAVGSDLSLGEPVGPAPGQTYVAETHGDWEIRCLRVPEGQVEPCQLYQLLSDENGNPVAEFNLFDVPDEGQLVAGATIVTPLDTLLTPQLRLSVDGNQPRQYPFAFCQPVGCFVRLGLTEADLQAFRAGNSATVSIVPLPAPDQLVDLRVSLSGFTAGFNALSERSAPPAE